MTAGKVKSIEKTQKAPESSSLAHASARQAGAGASAGGLDAAFAPQMAGNLAVQQLFRSGHIQAKLAISQPGDPDEEEADRVADRVMRMAEPGPIGSRPSSIQRKCAAGEAGGATCPKCEEEEKIRRKETPGHTPQAASLGHSQVAGLRGGGQPLPPSARAFFEPRFGRDFSHVRVHNDGRAAESASAIGAKAFTSGQDVVFGAREYAPESRDGKKLLAHELTHVVQQQHAYGGDMRQGAWAPGQRQNANASSAEIQSDPIFSGRSQSNQGRIQRQADAGAAAGAPTGSTTSQSSAPQPSPSGPSISQGPLGDVVIPLGNLTLFDHDTLIDKSWNRDLASVELYGVGSLSIPGVTDLKTELGLFAVAKAHANFLVEYGPGLLSDLKVGMSTAQAVDLGFAALGGGLLGALSGAYWGKFIATARLHVPAHINLGFGIAGELRAGASLGVEIIYLETGLGADATVDLAIPPIERDITMYWERGRLHLERNFQVNPTLSLEFQLNAFIKAHLLNTFKWEKHWNLTKTPIDQWPIKILLELHGDPDEPAKLASANMAMVSRGKGVKMKVEQGELEPSELFKKVFKNSKGEKDNVTRTGGEERPAGHADHKAPIGTQDDPIQMIWAKPPSRYDNPIWLDTPNQSGREPFYRDRKKQLPNKRTIGIDESYLGRQGRVFEKGEKSSRGGKETDFKNDLEQYGYEGFSDGDYSPDHVRDLDWGGPDDYSNLWPLDRETNAAAGRYHSFQQEVEFNVPGDPPEAAPRKEKLSYEFFRGRYFRIKKIGDPEGL